MASLNIITFITFVLMVVGAVFAVLSTSGNYWEIVSADNNAFHMGLWKVCGKPFKKSYCTERSKSGGYIYFNLCFK